jgi:hypothetical protein
MAVDALAEKLGLLLEHGKLSSSRLTDRERMRLQSLFDSGVLETRRSGAGKVVVLQSRVAFEAFVVKNYPAGLAGRQDTLMPRSKAVAEFRDSKKAQENCSPMVLLRGFGNCELRVGEEVLPIVHWTKMAGVAALCFANRPWAFSGLLAVVENLEVFQNFEKLGIDAPLALYAQGRLSGKILDWLSSPGMAHSGIIHCGDYDPVGLDEYLRIKTACPERTRLHLPANLEELFSRYGKRELLALDSSAAVLARLRKTDDQEVRSIIMLIDQYGVGLEQEALLLGVVD